MWESRIAKRTTGKGPDASFEKHADDMQMMTWKNATRKQMTWQQRRITGRHLAHRIRGVTVPGKLLVADIMLEGREGLRIRTVDDLVFLG